ncbi:uncharacterized protein L3040_003762 [Drepanopeziza brunnea f. sp. 'multigermtubi']|uniref:Uncharacterized protein n=1 Tax=Marssonina brunnea f. sp. multigermtubi (strain MB_m1) TaxID=1072389 RepID=K1X2Q7_MARBU|nr:uncharacterized protein MBM_06799 [Drepanopeziza brunnea f. sp. 'multigermtubi' MB_m1]EKD15038.1 hypothetical protein MBM_06799 [Drepanopeziza brunnea f. sp. 'multigermtubi' MB_m1]KAJ5046519.1 hypothetical protein L3040_003762 [Drepanopeziza brunnea f. sp. 'multigermtubi']
MVILGGLELVAAGYILKKHCDNKREKQRIEDEAAALEEQQYRIFPSDGRGRHSQSQHRRRRSHSRRRHSTDGKYRKESPQPPMSSARPPQYINVPAPGNMQNPITYPPPPQRPNGPQPQQQQRPPQPQEAQYPPDIKYGWTDDEPARPLRQHDVNDPPTGWPANWEQSVASRAESSRGRQEMRTDSPHVRFASERYSPSVRSESRSPPPCYRA